jgi:hypothetical protein
MKIQERVEATGKGWAEWDTAAAKELAVEANEVDTMPRA